MPPQYLHNASTMPPLLIARSSYVHRTFIARSSHVQSRAITCNIRCLYVFFSCYANNNLI